MAALEAGLVASYIDVMVRHHELGHRLALGENAPREFLSVVAEAARRVAAARNVAKEDLDVEAAPAGTLRLAAIED
jgi:hypothetical protein